MWAITGQFGLSEVDRIFDEELAMGSLGFGGTGNVEMPIKRIDFFDASDPTDFPASVPDTPWCCRSNGIAVAPFLIVDEVAWQDHILSGFAGRRAVFWFFGISAWVPLKQYWVS